jgi:hypothetical protein
MIEIDGEEIGRRIAGSTTRQDAIDLQWELDDLYRRVPAGDRARVLALRERLYERHPILHGRGNLGQHRIPILAGADTLFYDLAGGHRVRVDRFIYDRTYSGFLEGVPNGFINGLILDETRTAFGVAPGRRGRHLIAPELDHSYPGAELIPPARFAVWLESRTAVTPGAEEGFGSELTVVWFGNVPRPDRMGELIGDAIADLPWDDLAEDVDNSNF